jgi:hypothetical protein
MGGPAGSQLTRPSDDAAKPPPRLRAVPVDSPPPARPASWWEEVDLLAARGEPEDKPDIAGISYPGNLALHFGEPTAAKSWLNLILCVELAREDKHSLWFDREMNTRLMIQRLDALGATDEEIQRIHYRRPDEIADAFVLHALAERYEPALCVYDALVGIATLEQLDEYKGPDVEYIYQRYARPFMDAGAAVHFIDHVIKDKEARGRWATGSQRKLGGVDVGLSVEMMQPFGRGKTGRAKIVNRKDRFGGLAAVEGQVVCDIVLVSDPETHKISWRFEEHKSSNNPLDNRPTWYMEQVSKVLEAQVEPMSQNAIETLVGRNRDYVRKALLCLEMEGYARHATGPRSAKLYSSLRAFRDNSHLPGMGSSTTSPDLAQPRPGRSDSATSPDLAFTGGVGGARSEGVEARLTSPGSEDDMTFDDDIPF